MKKLLPFLKPYKKEVVLAPLFKWLEAIFELIVPLVMAAIIDIGIPNQDRSYVLSRCLLMILLGFTGLISSVTAQYFSARAAVGFATDLKSSLFAHLKAFSYENIDKIGTDTMITRMTTDVVLVQNGVNLTLRLLLRSPFLIAGALLMSYFVNPRASLWIAIAIVLILACVFFIMWITIPGYKKVQEKLDRLLTITRENLSGVRVIRAFALEKKETEEFNRRNKELFKTQKKIAGISSGLNPLTFALLNTALAALLWNGSHQVYEGILTKGELIALVNYMSQILVEIIKLVNLVISINKALAGAKRLENAFAFEDRKSEKEEFIKSENLKSNWENSGEHNEMIVAEELTFHYPQTTVNTLENLNFKIPKGKVVGILGGTGSGKSTLLSILSGFYLPSGGKISSINDKKITESSKISEIEQSLPFEKLVYVEQRPVLFKSSIRDNISWGDETITDDKIWEALEAAQAKDFVMKLPEKLDTQVNQGGKNFSGGQRQRLSIARGIAQEPDLLMIDDGTSALDYVTEAALKNSLFQMVKEKNMTLVLSSQRTSTVMNADMILVLEDGKSDGFGPHSFLMEHSEVYKEIYQTQFPL